MAYNEREAQRKLMQRKRSADRDIEIRKSANRKRKKQALSDVYGFLDLYFGHRFYNPLTKMHRDIVEAILYRAEHGGDQAIAAPRGEGKTTIAECVVIYCILKGLLRFPVIMAATGPDAKRILDNIKHEFETNELLAADFPEVCDPILALEGGTSRQNMQTVDGVRTRLRWSAEYVVFPTVPKRYLSNCAGSVLSTKGLDGSIRGIRHESLRPDFILIDDPETRESAASESQVETREQIVDRDIAGLGGQGKKIARVALCTLQNQNCLAAKLTDPVRKPSWAGRRYKAIEKWPDDTAKWERYISIRNGEMAEGDPDAIGATAFYLNDRDAMDAGAVLSNPANYVRESEHSALQACYNWIADKGMPAFLTERQNDPPDEDELNPNQISSAVVAKRISGLGHLQLPTDTQRIVGFVDVMDSFLTFTESAWQEDAIGSVTDYGRVNVERAADKQALELALIAALHAYRERLLTKYAGQIADLVLIDSGDGDHTNAVYQFCHEVGPPFAPSKGWSTQFTAPKAAMKRGEHWAYVPQPNRLRTKLYHFDATFWKRQAHQRLLTKSCVDDSDVRSKGSLALFVCPDQAQFIKDRREFTHQVTNEVWGIKKMGSPPGWMVRGPNHYFDCVAGNCLAANIQGVLFVGDARSGGPIRSRSFAEMRAAAQRK